MGVAELELDVSMFMAVSGGSALCSRADHYYLC
jgi:hypothetical protein